MSKFVRPLHVRGRRSRGSRGKIIIFGLLKRGDKVYTQIINKYDRTTFHTIIKERTSTDSIINSDSCREYNDLLDFDNKRHYRVHHGKNEFVRGNSYINGIESFWGYAKTRLAKFRGMSKSMFELHLKECEFRFNNRKQNLYKFLLAICRKKPLN